jgi:hypothetical protein
MILVDDIDTKIISSSGPAIVRPDPGGLVDLTLPAFA